VRAYRAMEYVAGVSDYHSITALKDLPTIPL
jgi:hypothetical protein